MANIITLKHGNGTPNLEDLQPFELGYNYSDRELYIRNKQSDTDDKLDLITSQKIIKVDLIKNPDNVASLNDSTLYVYDHIAVLNCEFSFTTQMVRTWEPDQSIHVATFDFNFIPFPSNRIMFFLNSPNGSSYSRQIYTGAITMDSSGGHIMLYVREKTTSAVTLCGTVTWITKKYLGE